MGYKAQRRPCKGTNAKGQPCRAYAMLGSMVCHKHGGMAPQVRGKAKERQDEIVTDVLESMRSLIPKAIKAVEDVMNDPEAKAADRLKAADTILDRFVAKQLHTTTEDHTERDLDAELEAEMADLDDPEETGT